VPDSATTEAAEQPAAAALEPVAEHALARLEEALGDAIIEHGAALGGLVVRVRADAWRRAAEVAKDQLGCDYLSFVSGIDWMPAPAVADEGSGDTSAPVQPRETTFGVAGSEGRMQVFAHVESTHQPRLAVTLKVDVDSASPHAESWVPVYAGADWHERETWEMYGIVFDGHPSLRHLYLPSEFEGHPLRKDFPLLAREVKPWPGLVDVEPMPSEASGDSSEASGESSEASGESRDASETSGASNEEGGET
jgi:NADH-quinone oxidoreductase subunit C